MASFSTDILGERRKLITTRMWILRLLLLVSLLLWSCLEQQVSAEEVTIYDSSTLEALNWEQKGDQLKWWEGSYNLPSGAPCRAMAVCNVYSDTSNWVSTTPLVIPASVMRISVNLVFTTKKCSTLANANHCKEVFKLAYEESGLEEPNWDAFATVDTIAATHFLPSDPAEAAPLNNETRNIALSSLPPSKRLRSIRLGFLDEGSCTSLLIVRVYYEVCPQEVSSFVLFPETAVGSRLSSLVEARGRCVDNSVPVPSGEGGKTREATRLCQADGKWYRMETDGCHCKPGFRPNTSADVDNCIECPMNFFKTTPGDQDCQSCPSNSASSKPASTFCPCDPGFERLDPVSYNQPCYKVIGQIRNLTVTNVSETSVLLSWSHPHDMASSSSSPSSSSSSSSVLPSSLAYHVDCPVCNELPYVRYLPGKSGQFNSVNIVGLKPGTSYTVLVKLRNETTRRDYNSSLVLTTFSSLSLSDDKGSPSNPPIRAQVSGIIEDSVQLVWETSLSLRSFEIAVFFDGDKEYRRLHVYDFRNVSIDRLEPGQTYSFMIRGETANGWTMFSNPVYARIGDGMPVIPVNLPHGGRDAGLVGAAVGGVIGGLVFLLLLILIALVLYYRRFKNPGKCTNSSSDCDILKYVNATIKTAPQISSNTPSDSTLRSGESFHIYADPTSFEHDMTMTSLKSLELNPSLVVVRGVLNMTWSGELCQGVLVSPENRLDKLVTIETIKKEAFIRGRRSEIKVGAGLLRRLEHPNIVKAEGFVGSPQMIVMEYMQNGCLKDFLTKSKSSNLGFLHLLGMLRDAASGMHYLSERGLIHQTLTTESILVNGNLVCKISSLHCVTTVESEAELKSGNSVKNIPTSLIRWSAPELLFNNTASPGSDVWSFGMVMWQTLSRGEDPYSGWTDEEVLGAVSNSMCLSSPSSDCPDALYQLMMQCWRLQKDARPGFGYILQMLTSFRDAATSLGASSTPSYFPQDKLNLGIAIDSESPQAIFPSNLSMTSNNGAFSPSDRSNHGSNFPYLTMYRDLLQSKGYNTTEKILMLEDPGLLTNIGIVSPTHQFFLLNEIQKLRHRDSDNADLGRSAAQQSAVQGSRKDRPHSQHINYQHFNNIEKFKNINTQRQQQQPYSQQQQQQQQQQISPPPTQATASEFSSRQNLLLATSHLNLNGEANPGDYNTSSNFAKLQQPHYHSYNSFTTKAQKVPNNNVPLDKGQKYRMGISALTSQKHLGENFFV